MLARALVVWFALLAVAFGNGALRELVLVPRLGPAYGHLASTLSLCALILAVTKATIGWIAPADAQAAWTVGGCWLVLTLAFEFLGGHFLFGKPWATLFADYDVRNGRVWVLVLVATVAAPALAAGGRIRVP
jgi:hypothetical protein